MNQEELKARTKDFAKRIVALCRNLPDNREGRLIGNQIFRSGTSVAANYRAACRARSQAEFIAKMSIVEEEADESLFWLELLTEMEIVKKDLLVPLMQENNELIAIVVASIKTCKASQEKGRGKSAIPTPQWERGKMENDLIANKIISEEEGWVCQ
ncbi:MAG: four helix bundle protein [Thermodesulfobacteriota bacterium]